jgi:hypothetical protein
MAMRLADIAVEPGAGVRAAQMHLMQDPGATVTHA